MLPFLQSLRKSFLDLLYPPICLHCDDSLEGDCSIFCHPCLQMMEQIDPAQRCPLCFSSDFCKEIQKVCDKCKQQPRHFQHIASVFDYEGPAATLVRQLKYGGQSYLAKGGGAFLVSQFLKLDWPIPDFIIPMPMSRLRKMERGYNQSELLAASFAALLQCPVSKNLKRHGGDFSQAGMNHKQRVSLKSDSFYVVNGDLFHDKTLLLIDDVMTTGSSLHCCVEVLNPFFPKDVYALTLCRTL